MHIESPDVLLFGFVGHFHGLDVNFEYWNYLPTIQVPYLRRQLITGLKSISNTWYSKPEPSNHDTVHFGPFCSAVKHTKSFIWSAKHDLDFAFSLMLWANFQLVLTSVPVFDRFIYWIFLALHPRALSFVCWFGCHPFYEVFPENLKLESQFGWSFGSHESIRVK